HNLTCYVRRQRRNSVVIMSALLHPQPHINIHQDGARHAEKHHPILRPMDYHLHRRALPPATSPVAPTIPDDVVAAAVLHPYHLVALLHQHFLCDDQCTVVRDRVLLAPLPACPTRRRVTLRTSTRHPTSDRRTNRTPPST